MSEHRQWARGGAVAGLTVLVLTTAMGCGSSSSSSSSSNVATDAPSSSSTSASAQASATPAAPGPSGSPVKFLALSILTGPGSRPEDSEAAKAAVHAINAAGGLDGRPVQIDMCDEGFTPNTAEACAHTAVSGHYLAVIGENSGLGDSILPITDPAGIPLVADSPASATEGTDPLSFPSTAPVATLLAGAAVISGKGGKTANIVAPDLPAASGLAQLVKSVAPAVGITLQQTTLLPITGAVDYSQYAQQAYDGKSDGVFGVPLAAQVQPLLSAALAQGADFTKTTTALSGALFDESLLSSGSLANKLNGIYLVDFGYDVSDSTNPGIAQYLSELKAINSSQRPTQVSLNIWMAAHMLQSVIAKTPAASESAAGLVSALKTTGPITPPGWVTLDFTKPALGANPLAKVFPRYATTDAVIYKVVDNKLVDVSGGPVNSFAPIKVSQ